jgi:hypothetical protein
LNVSIGGKIIAVRLRPALATAAVLAWACAAAPAAPAAVVGSSPASSWQTNGQVDAIAVVGTKIFIGGKFTRVRPPGSSATGVVRNHLAAFDLHTGALMPWNPGANGTVTTFAVKPGGATIYIGGNFTSLHGKLRARIGAVATDGGRLRTWHANANGRVEVLRATRTRVYAGGEFTTINGATRHRLAAIGTGTAGRLAAWSPNANAAVLTLRVSANGAGVFIGGSFTAVNGHAHRHLAKVSAATGALLTQFRAQPLYTVMGLVATRTTLYVGGAGSGGHVAALTPGTGAARWRDLTDGDVRTMALRSGVLYVGGHFNNFCQGGTGSGGPLVCTTPAARRKLLALNPLGGALLSWNPDANSVEGVFALAAEAAGVQAGGAFTVVHGVAQQGFARFT